MTGKGTVCSSLHLEHLAPIWRSELGQLYFHSERERKREKGEREKERALSFNQGLFFSYALEVGILGGKYFIFR